MHRLILLPFCCAIAASFQSAAAESALRPVWEDQSVFRANKEAAHVPLVPYADADEALDLKRMKSPWVHSLNGDWFLRWSPNPESSPENFYQADFDASDWDIVSVPSNVELQGYGTPLYTNIQYPMKVNPPTVTDEPPAHWTFHEARNPISAYRKTFELPSAWAGRQVYLVFNGVNSAFHLYVNGVEVGYSQDSRTPAEFNITDYLQPGENLLAVKVYRHSDGSYLEDQDFWRLSGIFRDVYLWSSPILDLRDLEIDATLDDHYEQGVLTLKAWPRTHGEAEAYSMDVRLLDAGENLVAETTLKGTATVGRDNLTEWNLKDLDISPWSAEAPHLYRVLIDLKNADGDIVAHYADRIGFVRTEIKDGNFLVNGEPILFKGVNRHDHDHLTGHYVTEATMREELELMKRFNINAVRTSHYPNDPRFLELTDEYGFYVISEANIETHGFGNGPENRIAKEPSWLPALQDRVSNMVEMAKNRPSVVSWSLGNEAGSGPNFEALAEWVQSRDPLRPVHYEGAKERDYVDYYSPMYYQIGSLEAWCERESKKPLDEQRPLIQCEYNHAMGNSSGGLAEYWDLFRKHRHLQGGFIWDWRNQGIRQTKPADPDQPAAVSSLDPERFVAEDGSLIFFAYGGDFGDIPNDDNFCMNGIVAADLSPTPQVAEIIYQYRDILTDGIDLEAAQPVIRIFNEKFFTSFDELPLKWSLLEDGREIQSGELVLPEIAPQTAIEVTIPVEALSVNSDAEYFLNIAYAQPEDTRWAEAGFVFVRDQLPLAWTSPEAEAYVSAASSEATLAEREGQTIVDNGNARFVLDDRSSRLLSYQVDGEEMLVEPLELNLWRAPVDNDRGFKMGDKLGFWKDAADKWTVEARQTARHDSHSELTYQLTLPDAQAKATVTYKFYPDGALGVAFSYTPAADAKLPDIPRIGFQASLPAQYDEWTWYGRGPGENHSDRATGSHLGVWSGDVDQLWYPYAEPQETGNRTGVRWASWLDENGKGLKVRSTDGQPLEMAAWPFLQSDLEGPRHPADIPQRDLVTIQIAHRQMGVGGENSWGILPRPDHRISAGQSYDFAFVLQPVGISSSK